MEKLFMVLVLSSLSLGAVIIETVGDADPVAAGFSFTGNGTYSTGAGFDSEPYWFTRSTRAASYLYKPAAAYFTDPSGWTATWRTKTMLDQSTYSVTDNFLCARSEIARFDISIYDGLSVLLKTGYVRVDVPEIDESQWHTYQITYDPTTLSGSYYIDGELKATYAASLLYTPSSTIMNELRWGDQNSNTTAAHENRYSLVRFETGRNPDRYGLVGVPLATEGGAAGTYTVTITGQPTAPVVVTVTADTQCRVNGQSQVALTFTPGALSPQTVTVTAVDDAVQEGGHNGMITHAASSSDTAYNFTMRNVFAAITDNDQIGVNIDATEFDVAETDTTPVSYQLSLKSQPASDVTIQCVTDSQVMPIAPVVFSPSNWNVSQTITVYVVNDILSEGPHSSIISHAVSSADVNYNNFCISNVILYITDDEEWCGQAGTFYFNADFNHDCYINIGDLGELAAQWLMTN